MNFCLVVQKDTLENNRVKSVLNSCENPQEYLTSLQENHCIEYQLVAHTSINEHLDAKLLELVAPFKTNYGKDWYEFDQETLSKIVSLFLEYDTTVLNLKSISSVMGFSFSIFPTITKEVVVSPLSVENVEVKEEIINLIENLHEKSDLPRNRKKDKKNKK